MQIVLTPGYAGPRTRIIFTDPSKWGIEAESYWYAPSLKTFVKYVGKTYINNRQIKLTTVELVDYRVDSQAFGR
jgi:hypothetical protein